ncbi:MAG: TolC family protein [Desulfobacteraceae bacterium]|jgi:outer membrane protein|nr:TolC family protein [Desulfobacteraceae bacterium]
MIGKQLQRLLVYIGIGLTISYPAPVIAQETTGAFNLTQTIETALKANLSLKQSKEEVNAALATKKARTTNFFPTLRATYGYIRRDQETRQSLQGQQGQQTNVIINPEDEYNFITSFSQPIFTGFALINQYKIASMGLDVAEISEKLTRQDIILDAKNAYFSILKSQKLMDVAEDTVKQVTAQKEVAENMYQVGMSPLNDLLQSQVQLANDKQRFITAQNNLEISKSQFNTLLRRPVNAPVAIVDILDYTPFDQDINYCLAQANQNRLELQVADLEVQIAQKDYQLSKRNYFPSIDLTGTLTRRGTDWDVDGGEGIADKKFWDIRATASWDFWEWGRTRYGVKEKLSRLSQAKYGKENILDNIELEVKQAFLRTKESEKNITTIEKAIEQAKENLRITEERYKEQVSTTTDVLVAQTLLTETMTNYYNALYDFKIAKSVLYRAIGQEVME